MATDRDDDVARRYRALAREEPPAHLDAAILAAGRRAVRARPPGFRRWAPSLSIAAVLVLAAGLVMRMQVEQPGIETAAPTRSEIAPPDSVAESAAATPPAAPSGLRAAAPANRATEPVAKPEPAAKMQSQTAPRRELSRAKRERDEPPREPGPAVAATASAPPPPPMAAAPAPQVVVPLDTRKQAAERHDFAAGQANLSAGRAAPPPAAASSAPATSAPAAAAAPAPTQALRAPVSESPEAALERIAKLREAGRDGEADRALETFRRAHPGYQIPDALWQRVKPRNP